MALYRGREVQIVTDRPHKYTDRNQVLIQHTEDPSLGTEVVDRAQLVFNEDEINKMLEEEEKDMKARRESFQRDLKSQEEEQKKSQEYQEEVAQARKENKPPNAYLKTATYQKGDQVQDEDGVLYRSRANDNVGNAPGKDSDYWAVVISDRTGGVPLAAPTNVMQTPTPQTLQVQQQAQPQQVQRSQTQATPQANRQATQPVTNTREQRNQPTVRGR